MVVETFTQDVVLFQVNYCYLLSFSCPTKEQFDFFDANQDGTITWSEWESKSQ